MCFCSKCASIIKVLKNLKLNDSSFSLISLFTWPWPITCFWHSSSSHHIWFVHVVWAFYLYIFVVEIWQWGCVPSSVDQSLQLSLSGNIIVTITNFCYSWSLFHHVLDHFFIIIVCLFKKKKNISLRMKGRQLESIPAAYRGKQFWEFGKGILTMQLWKLTLKWKVGQRFGKSFGSQWSVLVSCENRHLDMIYVSFWKWSN